MSKISDNCAIVFPDSMVQASKSQTLSELEMIKKLQGSNNDEKVEILRHLIVRMASGDKFPKTLMSLMNCLYSDNKTVKKLALYVWEVVDRRGDDGKLLPEMILVCNALKVNLEHPNEFIRGVTLRLVSKLLDDDILHPLMPSIMANLTHRHGYVRKCAAMAILNISQSLPDLVSHLDDELFELVTTDNDLTTRRNALLALMSVNIERAISYFGTISNILHIHSEGVILAVIELILKTYSTHPQHRTAYVNSLLLFLSKPANSVATAYEAAKTLLVISRMPSTIEQALSHYIKLLLETPDYNVKLSILFELHTLSDNPRYTSLLQSQLMTIIRILETAENRIRVEALQLALKLSTHRTVNDLILFLRKELLGLSTQDDSSTRTTGMSTIEQTHSVFAPTNEGKLTSSSHDVNASLSNAIHSNVDITSRNDSEQQQYRHHLLKTLHQLSLQYPPVMTTVAPLLGTFLADTNPTAALNALQLIKEVMFSYKALRGDLALRLLSSLPNIRIPEVARGVVWILGEFTGTDYTSSLTPPQSGPTGGSIGIGSGGAPTPLAQSQSIGSSSSHISGNDIFTVIYVIDTLLALNGLHSFDSQRAEYERQASHERKASPASAEGGIDENPTQQDQEMNQTLSSTSARRTTGTTTTTTTPAPSYFRTLLIHSDLLFASTLAVSLSKLFLRLFEAKHFFDTQQQQQLHTPAYRNYVSEMNRIHASILLLLTRALQLIPRLSTTTGAALVIPGGSGVTEQPDLLASLLPESDFIGTGHDSYERITACVRILLQPTLAYPSTVSSLEHQQQHTGSGVNIHPSMNLFNRSSTSLSEAIRHRTKREKEIKEMEKQRHSTRLGEDKNGELSSDHSSSSSGKSQSYQSMTTPIPIRLLRKNMDPGDEHGGADIRKDIHLALTGTTPSTTSTTAGSSALNPLTVVDSAYQPAARIHQLTGFGDLIYAEAQVILSDFELTLKLTFINQSTIGFQNIHVQLNCSDDLEIIQYPPSFSLGTDYDARSFHTTCHLRVNNTESGTISGSIVCGGGGATNANQHIILFSPLHIGITQYIVPASCSDVDFRSKWAEFLWENKVLVATNISSPLDYLHHIKSITNMHCLTTINNSQQHQSSSHPIQTTGDGEHLTSGVNEDNLVFLAANLYAISVFGEAALLNLSVESNNGKLSGYLRIRAKTEGIARGLGEILKTKQRLLK